MLDTAEYDPELFAPVKNTITMGKLLMLNAPELNQVLSDILGRKIVSSVRNVMVDSFDATKPDDGTALRWLALIDGDHAWRGDGLPKFINSSDLATLFPSAILRPVDQNGGPGTFPMWESVVLRPAFKHLFTDWENGDEQFPELGDSATPDLVNDPFPPVNTLMLEGNQYNDGTRQFVGKEHHFVFTAKDTPEDMAFKDSELKLQFRYYLVTDPLQPGSFVDIEHGGTFTVTGIDGSYLVDIRSADPCHTFINESEDQNGEDPFPPGETESRTVILDATPPVLTCAPPFGLVLDTDEKTFANFLLDDGGDGSGWLPLPRRLTAICHCREW